VEISFIDASKKSVEGRTIKIRDPRVRRNYDADVDNRPFLRVDDANPRSDIVTIDIYGPDHPVVKRLLAPQRARYMQAAFNSQSKKGVRITPEEIAAEEAENLDIAVAATRGWHGFKNMGEVFPCNAENARQLYTMSADIQGQVLDALRDAAGFLND
jgi:hypothetical protein